MKTELLQLLYQWFDLEAQLESLLSYLRRYETRDYVTILFIYVQQIWPFPYL